MILYPAIDLKGGQAVRLIQGDMAQDTVFNSDPADQARQFAAMGFDWLHVVDLDGAFAGKSVNGETVKAIRATTQAKVQLGGGIRSLVQVEAWLDAGVDRVILGTIAARGPDLVKEAARQFPNRIVVGIDARDGMVAVEGWGEVSSLAATDLALRFEDAGVAAIVFTDIGRDGMLQGVNIAATQALAEQLRTPVIASGGLKDLEDLRALLPTKISGVIAGRALYDGRLDAKAALALIEVVKHA